MGGRKKENKRRVNAMKMSIIITAMLCVTLLEVVAMCMGINGQLLRIVIGALLLLAGVLTPTPNILKGGR